MSWHRGFISCNVGCCGTLILGQAAPVWGKGYLETLCTSNSFFFCEPKNEVYFFKKAFLPHIEITFQRQSSLATYLFRYNYTYSSTSHKHIYMCFCIYEIRTLKKILNTFDFYCFSPLLHKSTYLSTYLPTILCHSKGLKWHLLFVWIYVLSFEQVLASFHMLIAHLHIFSSVGSSFAYFSIELL